MTRVNQRDHERREACVQNVIDAANACKQGETLSMRGTTWIAVAAKQAPVSSSKTSPCHLTTGFLRVMSPPLQLESDLKSSARVTVNILTKDQSGSSAPIIRPGKSKPETHQKCHEWLTGDSTAAC
jgi:hypothetical protein